MIPVSLVRPAHVEKQSMTIGDQLIPMGERLVKMESDDASQASDGLDRINYNPYKIKGVIDALAAAHNRRLKSPQ